MTSIPPTVQGSLSRLDACRGLSYTLANRRDETIGETEVGFELDSSATVVSAVVTPTPPGYPSIRIDKQFSGRRNEGRLWIPYLKKGEELLLSLLSVQNMTPHCAIFVPQADVVARDLAEHRTRRSVLIFAAGLLGMLNFAIGAFWGISLYGLRGATSEMLDDGFRGAIILTSSEWRTAIALRRQRRAFRSCASSADAAQAMGGELGRHGSCRPWGRRA